MSLRKEIILTIAICLTVLTTALCFFARIAVYTGVQRICNYVFEEHYNLEENRLAWDGYMVLNSIENHQRLTSAQLREWAVWDGLCNYLREPDAEFAAREFHDQALFGMNLDLILLVDSNKNPVITLSVDPQKRSFSNLASVVQSWTDLSSLSPDLGDQEEVSDIIDTSKGLLLLSSRYVTSSDGMAHQDEFLGQLTFGRFLDRKEIYYINSTLPQGLLLTKIDQVNSSGIGSIDISHELEQAEKNNDKKLATAAALPGAVDVTLQSGDKNDDIINYKIPLTDKKGTIVAYLSLRQQRKLLDHTERLVQMISSFGGELLLWIAAGTLTLAGITLLVMRQRVDKKVLLPLAEIKDYIEKIGISGDFSNRIPERRNFWQSQRREDEIQVLIRGINSMLSNLSTIHGNLKKRSREIDQLLNTIPIGLVLVNAENKTGRGFSRVATEIFATEEIANKPLSRLLHLPEDRAAQLEEYLQLLREGTLPPEDAAQFNPVAELTLKIGSEEKIITSTFHLADHSPDEPPDILCMIEDVTRARQLEKAVNSSREENERLRLLVDDPDLFGDFLSEARTMLQGFDADLDALDAAPGNDLPIPCIDAAFRRAHALKGAAGGFGVPQLSRAAAHMEDILATLRQQNDFDSSNRLFARRTLGEMKFYLDEIIETARDLLNTDIDDTGEIHIHTALSEIRHAEDAAKTIARNLSLADASKNEVISQIHSKLFPALRMLRMVPARKGLARALRTVDDLARNSSKRHITFVLEGGSQRMDCSIARGLNAPIAHMIRNAYYHGIEDEEQRFLANKPKNGTVRLSIFSKDKCIIIELYDDGQGLSAAALRQAAVDRGFLTAEQAAALDNEKALALMFKAGLTTAREVNDISGRGVGMDAVWQAVHFLGGTLTVETEVGKGTLFTINIPEQS